MSSSESADEPDVDFWEPSPEEKAHTAAFEAAEAAVVESPGYLAQLRWKELERGFRVFERNTFDLMRLLDAARSQKLLIIELTQNVREPVVRDEFLIKLDQRLHNMVAGAASLVDQMRVLAARYPDSEFAAEYNRRNDVIRDDPRSVFLRRLRNYLLHYGVAPFQLSGSFGPNMTAEVTLVTEDLLKFKEWGAGGKVFLASRPEGVMIVDEVRAYKATMDELYLWVFEQFESLHGDETDATNELIRKRNLILSGGLFENSDQWQTHLRSVIIPNIQKHVASDSFRKSSTD